MTKREGIIFGCLLTFLLLPNIVGTFVAQDLLTIGQRIIYLITSLAIYTLGLTLFRRRTFLYVASLGFLLSAIDLVHLIINHATTSLLFVFTIIKSEKGEFLELLSTYWIVLIIFFSLWGVYYYLAHRFIRQEYIAPLRKRMWTLGVIVLFLTTTVVGLKLRPKFYNMFNIHGQDMRTAAWVGAEKACPVNMFLSIYNIIHLGHQIAEQKEALQDFRFGAQYEPSRPKRVKDNQPIVVFLIGETSRYDHWQINGYERETSPLLLARDSQVVSFDSVYSVANLTTVSVPFILSRATPTNKDLYMEEASVVDAFHEAGYRTAWIADQSFNNHFLMRIAENCDYKEYVTDPGKEIFVDTVLLPPFRTQLTEASMPQFIALHSLGCHFKYSARYPESFQKYTPDMTGLDMKALFDKAGRTDEAEGMVRLKPENITAFRNLKAILVNSYDNAILYTDYFIDCVIRELEQTGRPAVLVYVGDHGENLLDDEKHMFLHGTYAGSYYEYHVPMFVWMSEPYKKLYPQKEAAIRHNQSKLTSTMCLFYSLLDLGEVTLPQMNPQLSFADTLMQAMDTVWGLDANLQPMAIPTRPQ